MNVARIIFQSLLTIVLWFALILQLYLAWDLWSLEGLSAAGIVMRFLSFFTILSNLMAAFWFTTLLINAPRSLANFFAQPKVQTAITIYITVVGLGYAILLRALWAPQGLQWIADELLHSVNPLLVVVYWIAFVPKKEIEHKDLLPWLILPTVYLIYTLLRGALVGWYPYPFIDVSALGYAKTFGAIFWLAIAVIVIADLFVLLAKGIVAIKRE